jgi:hemerythrin-like domain-containing protein
MTTNDARRDWLRNAGMLIGVTAISHPLLAQPKKDEGEEDVSLAEDLMREHGVLKRVLLIYREVMNRIDSKREFPPDVVLSSAKLIRTFVEDYHEKLEEDYLFPRFRKANKLTDLVDVLDKQHQKGRTLTDRTILIANASAMKDASQRANLRNMLYQFVRMYEPHEAREDTILFPAFKKIVSKHEYAALGEEFEKKENQMFHGDGFEKNVDAVAKLEKELGVYDLAQFTPSV